MLEFLALASPLCVTEGLGLAWRALVLQPTRMQLGTLQLKDLVLVALLGVKPMGHAQKAMKNVSG